MTRTAFVFSGLGPYRVGMAESLLAHRPGLAATYFRAADDLLGIPLTRLCREGPAHHFADPAVAHPAAFVTGLAALEVLRAEGVRPDIVAGHGLGEYTALVAAGVLEWPDALVLVRLHAELVATAGDRVPGAMAAVEGLDAAAVARLCAESTAAGRLVEIACENGPGHTVVSGKAAGVDRLARAAEAAGATRTARLPVGGPFHSSLLGDCVAEFTEALVETEFHDPKVPVVSSVTARPVTSAGRAVVALRDQLTAPVRWTDTVRRLLALGTRRFVEAGPGPVLDGSIRRLAPGADVQVTGTVPGLRLALEAAAPAAIPV
ncbi:ACP S-malonyltransferase [Streptomyces sp. R35]|uniref:Malonyl CoA-acyl carrier protein transacylase n=1 Tax=Streptomyces sp. R35 TaxID=3238630 RepID=A0AB39S8R8_9ACTN